MRLALAKKQLKNQIYNGHLNSSSVAIIDHKLQEKATTTKAAPENVQKELKEKKKLLLEQIRLHSQRKQQANLRLESKSS